MNRILALLVALLFACNAQAQSLSAPLLAQPNTWTGLQTYSVGGVSTGAGQSTTFTPTGSNAAAFFTFDTGFTAGNGGAFVLGSATGYFGAIKGVLTNYTGPLGGIDFETRNLGADAAFTSRFFLPAGGGASVGTTSAALAPGEFALAKITPSGSAPGAGNLKFAVVAGTTAGTCKIIAYAGTSSTPSTILDNIGSGC